MRLQRDFLHLAEIAEISPRLLRSQHDVFGFLKSQQDRGEIVYILPRLPRSCRELAEIYKEQESRQDLVKTAIILPRVAKMLRIIPEGMSNFLHRNKLQLKLLCG